MSWVNQADQRAPEFELTEPNLPLGDHKPLSAKEQMDRLIRESKKLQRKSEQLNAGIEKLRSQIKKFEYNQLHPNKPRS